METNGNYGKWIESGMSNRLGYYVNAARHEEFGANLGQSTIQCFFGSNFSFFGSNFSRNPPIRFAASHLSPSGTRNKLVELTLARRHE